MRLFDDLITSLRLLTRIPMPRAKDDAPDLARALWAFPLAGMIVGATGAAALLLAQFAGLGVWLAAGLAIAAQILLTGALHEDGLSDAADGFGGGASARKCLEIMRDSHIGAYGVIALILVMGLRWGALASMDIMLAAFALIASGALSRLAIVIVLVLLPAARKDGLGASLANPPPLATGVAAAFSCAAVLFLLPPAMATLSLVLTAMMAALIAWAASRRIGGFTGDVLGAAAQLAEVAVLLGLVAMIGK